MDPTKNRKEDRKTASRSVSTKSQYTVTKHGVLNIVEVGAPLAVLTCVLLSSNAATPSRLLMVVSFAYAYVSSVMLAGGIVSPFSQARLQLSLYMYLFLRIFQFLLYHLVGSGFFVLCGGWLLSESRGEVLAAVAGTVALASGVVHFLHGLVAFVAVFNKPVAATEQHLT